ncbi:hypothetical protein BKA82DRAFT_4018244 [Pisolithus tinctorius]|nr:hypothetical protein BKA82DRAFT_4018244 [Pisolithus tinctorius]
MYEAGVYFLCGIKQDSNTFCYCIPWAKTFDPDLIAQAFEQGTVQEWAVSPMVYPYLIHPTLKAVMLNTSDIMDGDEPDALKHEVQMILEQMYYDILQESPNKQSHTQGAWTNILQSL